jgi:hypothetical protein
MMIGGPTLPGELQIPLPEDHCRNRAKPEAGEVLGIQELFANWRCVLPSRADSSEHRTQGSHDILRFLLPQSDELLGRV